MSTAMNVKVVDYHGKFAIQDEDGEFFYNTRDEVRAFKIPSDATWFLKEACDKNPGMGFIATLPTGKVKYIGEAMSEEEEERYGPHSWNKKNLVTLSDTSGMYDIYMCQYCHKEERSYGLSGHSQRSGVCKKNPLPSGGKVE